MAYGVDEATNNGAGNGNGISRLPGPGGKGKYGRIGDELVEHSPERGSESRRFVFACAIFASLNSVLLGYGEENLSFLPEV